jgi:hypothetical protein
VTLSSIHLIIGQRLWQSIGGFVTVIVIASALTPEQQGWYYTFVSMAALYSVFEMGLAVALVQISAHFFIDLQWGARGQVIGSKAREFAAMMHQALRIYIGFAIAFFGIALLVGWFVFSNKSSSDMTMSEWLSPWIAVLMMTAASMITLPFLAALEGGGQMREVYALRLTQGICGSLACWFVLLAGGALWATVMMPAAAVIISSSFLYLKRSGLGAIAIKSAQKGAFHWGNEVWPLQWRLGLGWVGIFLMSQLATPILFIYQDATVAGQMGLSLTLAHMVGIVAQSWLTREVPAMSQAVAKQEWQLFDAIFAREFRRSLVTFVIGFALLFIAYAMIQNTTYADRLLPMPLFVGLLVFVLFYLINNALATQLRSFKKEPLVWVFLFGALLIVVASCWAASTYSASGVVLAMLIVQVAVVFPAALLIWRNGNAMWRLKS